MCWRIFDIWSFCGVDVLILIFLSRIITELQRTVECDELKHESTSQTVRPSDSVLSPSDIYGLLRLCAAHPRPLLHRTTATSCSIFASTTHTLTLCVNISVGMGQCRSTVCVNVPFRSFIRCDNIDGLRRCLWLCPWQMGMWQRAKICRGRDNGRWPSVMHHLTPVPAGELSEPPVSAVMCMRSCWSR